MKLNFWQIVGGLLLVLGLIGIIYREFGGSAPATTQPTNSSAMTQPAMATPTK
ncbi:MAG: hypothetical protein JWM57_2284 [Phycisphaerales bacterium]|nr:hypothetical protein [Phycisphaerales bacterium]